jgi:NADH-quinone oxidoreductase subunit H
MPTLDPMQLPPSFWVFVVATIVKMLVVFTIYMVAVAYTTLAERKISAWIQDRHGPNRVGPWGLFQVLADGVKNIMKEETMPGDVNKPLFILAPAMAFTPALVAWAVIPFGAPLPTPWGKIDLVVADLPIGFLFTLAITSLGVYGIVLAGWASNNKYALLGGLRASAQMVSYEIAMGMSTVCVLLVAGNVSLNAIIVQQSTMGWNVLVLSVAAFLFLVAAFAETNRVPFDLPEAESELIAGYHSEYSAMKFSMFPISEYANMITASAMFVTLFFGGWDIPFTQWDNAGPATVLKAVLTTGLFAAKIGFFVFFYIWVRWTLPRFRYDQLMSLGWKFMLPVALAYIVIVASAILGLDALGLARGRTFGLAMFGLNLVLLVGLFVLLDRGRIISPAYSRLERERLGRLRERAVSRSHLAPGEIR